MSRLKQVGGIWYVTYTQDGRSKRRSTRTDDKVKALQFKAVWDAYLAEPPTENQQTIGALLDEYLKDRKGNVSSYDTLKYATAKLKPYFGAVQPQHLTQTMGNGYIKQMRKAGQSDGTTRRELGVLRAALEFGRRNKWFAAAPHIPMPPMPQPKERWLTKDEAAKLLDACKSPHIKTYMALGIYTGARRGAILDLTWDRVSLEAGHISFKMPGRPTSNKRRGMVPINATLKAVLEDAAILSQSDYVVEFRGGPVKDIKHAFKDAAKAAGLVGVTPHVLRHTCATWLIQAGVSFAETADFLCDSEQMIRKVYRHHSPEWLRGAASALEA